LLSCGEKVFFFATPGVLREGVLPVLQGVVCPIVTPLADGALDTARLEALLKHVLDGGVDAILVAGTNGEFACLSDKNWAELIARALSVIRQERPVIVNVSHCSLHEAISRASYAHECGASYVAATPPYYFALSNDEVVAFYHRLADASPLPLLLYNIPQYTKTDLYAVMARLATHPNIVGIKDSAGLHDRMVGLQRQAGKPFVRLVGSDLLVHVVSLHLDGVVPGLANLVPGVYHRWWQALQQGDSTTAQACEQRILALIALYDQVPGAIPYLQITRCGLRLLGIDVGEACSPLNPLPATVEQLVKQTLEGL
jgi:dihydrodipicolinate synthase/N-acetylneuraminate lyase